MADSQEVMDSVSAVSLYVLGSVRRWCRASPEADVASGKRSEIMRFIKN